MMFRKRVCVFAITFSLFLGGCATNDEPKPADCAASSLALTTTFTSPSACAATDGSISLLVTGGEEPYMFAIDAQPFGTSSEFTGLGSGTYTVKVRDNNNCDRSKTERSTLWVQRWRQRSKWRVPVVNRVAELSASMPPAVLSRILMNSMGRLSDDNTFTSLSPGNYIIRVTDDEGCSITQSAKVLNGTSFTTEVQSIISSNCAVSGCHVSGGAAPDFTKFSNIQARATEIKSKTQSGEMPKNRPKLPQANWI